MNDWAANLVDDDAGIRRILDESKRIAVLGIRPEDHGHRPACYVPAYLQSAGYEIVPVPVRSVRRSPCSSTSRSKFRYARIPAI